MPRRVARSANSVGKPSMHLPTLAHLVCVVERHAVLKIQSARLTVQIFGHVPHRALGNAQQRLHITLLMILLIAHLAKISGGNHSGGDY